MPEFDIKCLVSGGDTDGSIAVFEEIVAPGSGPPRHTHRNQIEIFHVIEGTIRFEVDGETSKVEPGGTALVPAGAIHAFRNDEDYPARIHFELLPAGDSEESFELLLKGQIGNDIEAFFDRYGMDLAGPPLD